MHIFQCRDNYQKLKTFIEGDPEVYDYLTNRLVGQNQPPKTSDGQATDSTKRTLGQTIIRDFEDRYGINSLDQEKSNQIRKAVASELAEKNNLKLIPKSFDKHNYLD